MLMHLVCLTGLSMEIIAVFVQTAGLCPMQSITLVNLLTQSLGLNEKNCFAPAPPL
uniref:Uncharacterized protein n=1 Tax=Setaria viridis TaxID=4556 RepID=A0A4U6UUK3_SETVI|nr:hypothetical protein SEVIR_5G464350v2 [Setaria viridis]